MSKVINQGFLITGTLLKKDGTSEDISGSILDVMIKKDFLGQNFPLFVVDFKTTEAIRNTIRDDDCQIKLEIYSYDVNTQSNMESEDNDDPTITSAVCNTTLRLYSKPFETTSAKKEEDDDESTSQVETAPFVYYRVSGIPEDLITKNSGYVNKIYNNVTIDEMLVNILSDAGIDNTYIQAADNTEVEYNVLIPPSTLIQSVDYIDDMYTIYNGICRFFLDYDKVYVYNPYSVSATPDTKIECKVISADNSVESDATALPSYDSNTKTLSITTRVVPGYNERKRIVGNSLGTNSVFYSYDENFNLVTRNSTTNIGYEKTQYHWNPSRRKMLEDNIMKSAAKASEAMTLSFSNISPEYFSPLSSVKITSDYPEPNGDYFITTETLIFSTTDTKHYTSVLNVILSRK